MGLKLISNGLIVLFTITSGIWLSKIGKPYNQIVFNIHKLVALAFIVYTFFIFKNLYNTIDSSYLMKTLIVLSVIAILTILVSGGILNGKDNPKTILVTLHKVISAVLLISVSAWFFIALQNGYSL